MSTVHCPHACRTFPFTFSRSHTYIQCTPTPHAPLPLPSPLSYRIPDIDHRAHSLLRVSESSLSLARPITHPRSPLPRRSHRPSRTPVMPLTRSPSPRSPVVSSHQYVRIQYCRIAPPPPPSPSHWHLVMDALASTILFLSPPSPCPVPVPFPFSLTSFSCVVHRSPFFVPRRSWVLVAAPLVVVAARARRWLAVGTMSMVSLVFVFVFVFCFVSL